MNVFAPDLFAGKVILISGAAGGVGRATATVLAALGARLVLTDVNEIALGEFAGHCDALALGADLRTTSECERVVASALAHYGRLDALINCAGIWVEGDSSLASEDDWTRCIDINLKACFFMCSRAIPALKLSRGAIVNISSDAGVVGNAGAAIYCASKGGVTVMSKALAVELAPHGIRVNALCPGDILTPMLQGQADRFGGNDPQGYLRTLLAHHPQGEHARFIDAAEVANYIAFLLSPAGTPVNGAHIMMDFGVTAGY